MERYKVRNWKSVFMLHWIINPGFAINELILGQRVPKTMLIKKDPGNSLLENSFIPCPHCGTIHSSLEWGSQNKTASGNWFGLYCNHCGKVIPCLRNLTSRLIITVTFPFWVWFKKSWEQKWLTAQKEKFSAPLKLAPPEYNVWLQGLNIGIGYYILIMIINYVIFKDPFTWKKPIGDLIEGIVIGLISASAIKETYLKKPVTRRSANKLTG